MANINIDTGTEILQVYKGIDFDFTFSISKPEETDKDIVRKTYAYKYIRDLNKGKEYETFFNKADWINVNNFTDNDIELTASGVAYLGYKYKVEFLNTDGTPIQTIKDYSEKYIYKKVTDTVTVPINLITTSIDSYKIKVSVVLNNGQILENTKEVILYNEPPKINATIENNKVFLKIDDEKGDFVRYNIKLNNKTIIPNDKEITDFQPPINDIIQLSSADIMVGHINTIVIYAEDNWGKSSTFTHEFMGKYIGILFMDENRQYYSTDMGDILKKLDFGTIVAGGISSIEKINIYNNTGKDIKDLSITITPEDLPEKLTVFYGFDENNLIKNTDKLINKNTIKDKETAILYLQVQPDVEFQYTNAMFEIKAQAITAI